MEKIFDDYLVLVIVIILFDYLTGLLKAYVWKVVDSSIGIKGIIKHSIIIFVLCLISFYSKKFEFTLVENIFLIMYGLNYSISILENLAVMGIYTPKFLITKVKKEKEKYEKKLEEIVNGN